MSSKKDLQVLIGGKVYTLSGYESAEYIQQVALYINTKINELNGQAGYKRLATDQQKMLLELNMADDFHRAKKRIAELESDLEDRDKAEYDMKHKLINVQIQLEKSLKQVDQLKDEINELQKQIVKLEARNYK